MSIQNFSHILGNSYAWSGKYSVGVYLHQETRKAYLFDSGPDSGTALNMDRQIRNKGYDVAAIIHSHSHTVNIGGSSYFSKQYPNLRCYASQVTADLMRYPSLLASGSTESNDDILITDVIPYEDGVFTVDGIPFQIYTLPGHFPGMIGVQTPDQVLFCADSLFGKSTLSRQKLLFFMDFKEAKESLEKLKTAAAEQYLLYHGGLEQNITELIEENINRMEVTYNEVFSWIEQQWQTTESIIQNLMSKYELGNDAKQYNFAEIITRANMRKLLLEGRISRIIKNGILFYKVNNAPVETEG